MFEFRMSMAIAGFLLVGTWIIAYVIYLNIPDSSGYVRRVWWWSTSICAACCLVAVLWTGWRAPQNPRGMPQRQGKIIFDDTETRSRVDKDLDGEAAKLQQQSRESLNEFRSKALER